MDIEKVLAERHELLERLRDSLQEELLVAELEEAENENSPEVLRVVFDEIGQDNEEGALGEFFFMPPLSEEDTVQLFSAVITIGDSVDKERLPELFKIMSFINFRIPCGGFCIDEEGEFMLYRLTVPLPAGLGKDQLYDEMNIVLTNALVSADMYMDLLLKVNEGEDISPDQF